MVMLRLLIVATHFLDNEAAQFCNPPLNCQSLNYHELLQTFNIDAHANMMACQAQ